MAINYLVIIGFAWLINSPCYNALIVWSCVIGFFIFLKNDPYSRGAYQRQSSGHHWFDA